MDCLPGCDYSTSGCVKYNIGLLRIGLEVRRSSAVIHPPHAADTAEQGRRATRCSPWKGDAFQAEGDAFQF